MPGAKKPAAKPVAKAAKPAAKAAPAKKATGGASNGIYIKNLDFPGIDNAAVKELFTSAGKIDAVKLRRNKYAIVWFNDAAGQKKALDFNGKTLKGKKITVSASTKAKPAGVIHGVTLYNHDYVLLLICLPHYAALNSTATTVFVNNLSKNAKKTQVSELFKDAGKIVKIKTYKNKTAGGCGFIYFESNAAAGKALKQTGSVFMSQKLDVKLSVRTQALDAAKEKRRQVHIVTNEDYDLQYQVKDTGLSSIAERLESVILLRRRTIYG
eukprot:gene11013-3314_t